MEFLAEKTDIRENGIWEAPLREIIDSVGMIEMLAFIEKSFDITIDDDEVTPETFQSLQATVEFIGDKKS